MTDIILKDEGDFVTVIYNTEKAKNALRESARDTEAMSNIKDWKEDVAIETQPAVESWCEAWDLTFEEF